MPSSASARTSSAAWAGMIASAGGGVTASGATSPTAPVLGTSSCSCAVGAGGDGSAGAIGSTCSAGAGSGVGSADGVCSWAQTGKAAKVATLDINNIFLNIILLLGKMETDIRLACRRAGDATPNQPFNTRKDASDEDRIHRFVSADARYVRNAHRLVIDAS